MGVHDLNINIETKLQSLCFVQLASGQVHVLSYFVLHEQIGCCDVIETLGMCFPLLIIKISITICDLILENITIP